MAEAFLMLEISRRSGRVKRALVTSSQYLTVTKETGDWAMLSSAEGATYEEARRHLLRAVALNHSWALRFIPPDPRAMRGL